MWWISRWISTTQPFGCGPSLILPPTDLLDYLTKTYLPYREEFARYSLKNYRNFDIKASQRAEVAHFVVKRLVVNRNISLDRLLDVTEEILDRSNARYTLALFKQRTLLVT